MAMKPQLGALFFAALAAHSILAQQTQYNVGVGIADCTGPAGEITFMGYARLEQKGAGIHLRQFARSFVFDDGASRVLFVSVDVAMVSVAIRKEVLSRLRKKYDNLYNEQNVIISATHTHSGPGGYNQYLFYDISVLGYMSQTFNGLVSGIVRSVGRAHEDVAPAFLSWNQGELLDANINRSPTAYLNNPEAERANYAYDVDKDMTQLKITRVDGTPAGCINWFAVHPTSMNNTNTLVSSDNVGYASVLFEQQMNPGSLIGKGKFVAAFASSNLGDVSPNTMGPHCIDNGDACNMHTSTCDGANVLCVASGPGRDMFESTKIIGEKLSAKALELFTSLNHSAVSGSVQSIHQYVDMTKQNFTVFDGAIQQNVSVIGCQPAMGYSFAAGTTDGAGAFTFNQGMTSPNELWNAVRDFIVTPSDKERKCQLPKPILFPTGEMQFPYPWQPKIVSTSCIMIGNFVILPVPGEFTTMAGRRLRQTIRDTITERNGSPGPVVIAGLSNTYSSYIVTPEEYELQRYEAASTLYGKHTLTIYQRQYKKLVIATLTNTTLRPGKQPGNFEKDVITLLPPVIFDTTPWDKNYGTCLRQPKNKTYHIGDRVTATFVSGHPRNHLLQEESFMTVERRTATENSITWTIVATDANWETKFHWYRTSFLKGMSEVRTEWNIPEGTEPGFYRLSHRGNAKLIFGGLISYRGHSKAFQVFDHQKEVTVNRSRRLFFQ